MDEIPTFCVKGTTSTISFSLACASSLPLFLFRSRAPAHSLLFRVNHSPFLSAVLSLHGQSPLSLYVVVRGVSHAQSPLYLFILLSREHESMHTHTHTPISLLSLACALSLCMSRTPAYGCIVLTLSFSASVSLCLSPPLTRDLLFSVSLARRGSLFHSPSLFSTPSFFSPPLFEAGGNTHTQEQQK